MTEASFPAPAASDGATSVAQARVLFFEQGADPAGWLAPHISRSWRRSRPMDGGGAFDAAPMPLVRLQERREQAMRLLDCAMPELDSLAEHAVGNGCVVILSDADGLILNEIGSPEFLPKAERFALMPGVDWSEHSRGTNAIGTALAEREALMVLGGEHYLAQNGALGCAAAPILTGRGEVAGVLDISGETMRVNQHALGLVRMAAQQVAHRLMLAGAQGHLLRFHRRPALLGTAREGLVVVEDGRIVAANQAALAMLGNTWEGLLDRHVEPLLGRGWSRLEHHRGLITLPDGQQIAATVERAPQPGRSGLAGTARPVAPVREVDVAADADTDDVLAPLLRQAVRVLDDGLPVLLSGETGSGKDVFARRLHAAGRRSKGPFVAINCAALPEQLIEAELFGYAEGAFTGARKRGTPGRIREAHGGILFLDEIGDMPLLLQSRLLRVLEERSVSALGGGPAVAVDFDLVCASHRDLAAMVVAGTFRNDLLYRVDGYRVALPALRERADRRALITQLFGELGGRAKRLVLTPAALDRLCAHAWPGNVRELCSVLRTLTALAEAGDRIGVEQLPGRIGAGGLPRPPGASASASTPVSTPVSDLAAQPLAPLADMARDAFDRTLAQCGGQVAEAAALLGVHRSTVYRHLAARRGGG
ncbi:transcriptional activator of acetoin/glycerol metabolism [Rhodoferax koreense]|uniref:Transcriptional activator of acetoin/glycerol metabolism n=1 Tax=Rhodoferax koreensis TaxID=1842727 RepID=A0A1P8K462_9BURK|nr:sigma-54-dependent Fis family transcriptional regulator [Rhodoferax koreense]APW40721.1 transcriptional activator of acetoin/glycerol metabolism [Rhodoferax koreense]